MVFWSIKCVGCKRWQVIQKPNNILTYVLVCRNCGKAEKLKKKRNNFISQDFKAFLTHEEARMFVMEKNKEVLET